MIRKEKSKIEPIITLIIYVFKIRWKHMIRYKGWFVMSLFIPVIFAAFPILIGTAIAGSPANAAMNFQRNVGTSNYALYMLIGTAIWTLAIGIMWDFGIWLRDEQQQGTLEQIFLAPTSIFWIAVGSSLFGVFQSLLQFVIVIILGGIVYQVIFDIITPAFLIVIVYIILGIIPLIGISLVLGSIVVKYKEATSLFNLLQPIFGFLMGIFYPITVLPMIVRYLSYMLPLTYSTNDARAVLLHLNYIFNFWVDLIILLLFVVIWPLLGLWEFSIIEKEAKKKGTLGAY